MKTVKTLLAVLAILLVSSCTHVEWNPVVWVGDYTQDGITSEMGDTIMCSNVAVNDYVCFHIDDIVELNEILDDIKMSKLQRKNIALIINKIKSRSVK